MRIISVLVLWSLSLPLAAQVSKATEISDSQKNRSNKTWQATFGLGHAYPFFGARARFSHFTDGNSLISLDLSGGNTWNGLGPLYSYSKTRSEGRKASIGYKVFLGNSFYVDAEGFYRVVARKADQFVRDIEFSSQAIGLELMIGHQWQWNRFTLGCDWIGAHIPVSVMNEKSTGADGSEYFLQKQKEFESFSRKYAVMLAGFYLGFSF